MGQPDPRLIVEALGGRWYRGGYGLALCPAHDDGQTGALSITVGDNGRLLLYCFAGCDFTAIFATLRARGLIGSGEINSRAYAPQHPPGRHCSARAGSPRRELVERIWREARPISGTLGGRYLRGRAIACDLPGSLRFHPQCFHGQTRRALPAMVAAVTLADSLVGVHRTWLAKPGRKADVEPQKAMLGPCRGSAVHLSDGPGPLVVAEGLETALSVHEQMADCSARVWAALSTTGVAGLVLPETPGQLIIAPDGDEPGVGAARNLARRARDLGWQVRIMKPPGRGKDWNDVAQEARK